MTKRAVIVHGWGGYPEEGWFPWLKQQLEVEGFEVLVPHMPDADEPNIESWIRHLSDVIGTPDQQTFFVGHSIGCQAILRYLATLNTTDRIGGAILVAGFFVLTGLEAEDERLIAEPWLTRPIDYERILTVCPRMTAIFSDNDEFVPLENVRLFEERLHPNVIIQHEQGHFSGSEGITELQIVVEEIKKWMA